MNLGALSLGAKALNLAQLGIDAAGNTRGLQANNGALLQFKKHRQNIFTRCANANVSLAANYGGYTSGVQMQLAGRPVAVRIGVWNADTTGTASIKASFGFDTAMNAVNSAQSKGANVAAWNNVTWGGAAGGTIAQPASAIRPAVLFSDWVGCSAPLPTDGTAYPILHLRLLQGAAAGNATWINGIYVPSTATEAPSLGGAGPVNRTFRGYRSTAAGDYTSANQSAFSSNCTNAVGGYVNFIVQYACLETGVTICTHGDSVYANCAVAGVLAANGWGWTARAVEMLHSAGLPVEFCNFGWSGQNSAQYGPRFQDLAPYIPNVLLCYQVYSSNNNMTPPLTQANVDAGKSAAGPNLALAQSLGMTLLLQTSTPANAPGADGGIGGTSAKQYWSGDALRTGEDAQIRAAGNYFYDPASVLSGAQITSGNATGQTQYQMAATGYGANFSDPVLDGTHPNDAGQIAWATGFANYVRAIL